MVLVGPVRAAFYSLTAGVFAPRLWDPDRGLSPAERARRATLIDGELALVDGTAKCSTRS